jgi:predicted N-acetyltransferase YhbS
MAAGDIKLEKPIIRPMKPEDIGAIIAIDQILTGNERATTLSDLVTEDLMAAIELSSIAEVNDQVVGFVLARHAYIGEPVVEAGLIQGLGVHPLYQRRGIATRLINALTESSRAKGIKTLRVMLGEQDSSMKDFFARVNFRLAQLRVYDKTL